MTHFLKKNLLPLLLSSAAFLLLIYFYQLNHVNVTREIVPILKGTAVETDLVLIKSGIPGKTVFVIGGIHGDETTGWHAADLLKDTRTLESGTLAVLSPANTPGCRNGVRNVEEYRDLNRSFPGTKDRDMTDRLAASIYTLIEHISPDIVIDLHEASREGSGRDFLGNSLIFSSVDVGNGSVDDCSGGVDDGGVDDGGVDDGSIDDSIESLVSDLILETQDGTLCTKAFSFYGPGPRGSLNREVSERLHLPVLTIEVSEEDPVPERLQNHLALVHRVLRQYGLESNTSP